MTAIAAVIYNGSAYVAGDSASVSGYGLKLRGDPKVFTLGPMVFGYCGSPRMAQLLRYKLTIPDHHPATPLLAYLATQFVDSVRQTLKDGGYLQIEHNVEDAGWSSFIVGYRGQLFIIESDLQVVVPREPYAAVGCGEDLVLGSLHATAHSPGMKPDERLVLALQAAEQFSAGVRGPFVMEREPCPNPVKTQAAMIRPRKRRR